MSTTLTMQNLIQHFEDRVRLLDRMNLGEATGKEPHYPQLVIYLGKNASQVHEGLSNCLLQLWPQYANELKFVYVDHDNGLSFREMICGTQESQELSQEALQELVSAMFGTKMHFADRSKLMLYYLLDTTSMTGSEDFEAWLPVMRSIKELLGLESSSMMEMLFLLLNENITRQKIAAQIRNSLSKFYTDADFRNVVSNVMLLSNRRSDNAILEDWVVGYQIVSAVIALSNNSDARVTGSIFSGCVMTASYAREEKPIAKIGNIVVRNMLNKMSDNVPQVSTELLDDSQLPDKLGLTKNGTFRMLDQYAEKNLFPMLPTEDKLELFPRAMADDDIIMSAMSARAFDEYTMGAWNQYLSMIAGKAREKVELNSAIRQSWSDEYKKTLVSVFNKEEIIYLANHLSDVRGMMRKAKSPSQDDPVLSCAKGQLLYNLSGDAKLIDIFVEALQSQGAVAQEFTDVWNSLLKSRRQIHEVRDLNMTTFYERKVRDYFDHQGMEVKNAFLKINDAESLIQFLKDVINSIIDSDESFSAAFEEELEKRLNEDAMGADARKYIRQKLTGNDVHTYLQTNFSLDEPRLSAILLKVDTPLYGNLINNLAPDTYYYNTGSGSAAEALVIYQVGKTNLVGGV